jgi:hypothetical protein
MVKLSLQDWETEEISALYGIISEVSPVKLCYYLNHSLGLQLARNLEDKGYAGKSGFMYYPFFIEENELLDCCWYLVSNRNPYREDPAPQHGNGLFANDLLSGTPLIPSLKMIDYFLWCTGVNKDKFDSTFNVQLKSTPYVRALQKLDTENIKGIEILTHN